ncbi:DUF362 domain-containing protein [Tunturiibacter gelidoferens]|uniref:DUF362 domain-containing protein n=1 Tax=Tunturiibacter gelidiferens TaxID=3069689 RepID=A0A9X0QF35_9BACT|nr:DUF362 domain-containing protein [Edaphobacter lichenicola]MBB5329098.1 hypothetical protein [Edaphobacter lichenicola]
MKMTRRHFALSIAAASSMHSSLFGSTLSPLGVPRGVVPGRVTWAHDPAAVTWDGTGSWWADANNNQAAIDRMVSCSIRGLTNQRSDAQAWSAIFHYFNRTHDRGNVGYKAGEKVAIKPNLNNTTDHGTIDRLNSSPHLILSLVRQLTGPGKVPQSSITIFDTSRFIPGNLYDKIYGEFPGVVFVDHIGGDGRLKAEFKPNAIPFSVTSRNASGLDTTVVEAAYLIDAALLKGHVSSGVTLCAKNLFGATSINPDWRKNAHDGFPPNHDGSPSYSAFVDFLGHKDLGEKTMLFIVDGLYGCSNADGPPKRKWKMAPFNDAWPSSIFMSLDGVAADSVGFDFLTSEWPDLVDIKNADNYLREAALANDPPSKTFYDPERDGFRCRSLGVHEHWNNGTDKKYSGNLGKAHGIELFQVG